MKPFVSSWFARLSIACCALVLPVMSLQALAVTLNAGDLVLVDISLKAIIKVDPSTGDRTIVSSVGVGTGVAFEGPTWIAVAPDGQLIVSDIVLETFIRVNPEPGDRSVVSSSSVGTGAELLVPPDGMGIAPGPGGDLFITAVSAALRIDPVTGDRVLASGTDRSSDCQAAGRPRPLSFPFRTRHGPGRSPDSDRFRGSPGDQGLIWRFEAGLG